MAVYHWRALSLVLLGCSSGTSEKNLSPTEELVKASEQVIFASVEKVGPHRSVSTFDRKEYHGEDLNSEHQEILQIVWKDWDNFQYIQTVDKEVNSDVVISNLITWEYSAGRWNRRQDGEPYRVQLRSIWNQWDNVMRHFVDHVTWTPIAQEVIEGRKTQKYVAEFTKPEDSSKSLRPISFDGTVWVDEQTAVRILGEIQGELCRGAYKKSMRLQVQRTDIGSEIVIDLPKEALSE